MKLSASVGAGDKVMIALSTKSGKVTLVNVSAKIEKQKESV